MAKYYIYSTHTNPTQYVEYRPNTGKNHSIIARRFTVMGGHGLCNKYMVTPQGVVTPVEREEDMEWLNTLPAFQKDIKKGFIVVTKRREDSERVVSKGMNTKDGSAPKTPKDYSSAKSSPTI